MAQQQLSPQQQSRINGGEPVQNPDGSRWRRGVKILAGDAAKTERTYAENAAHAARGGPNPDRTRDPKAEGKLAEQRYLATPSRYMAGGWGGQPVAATAGTGDAVETPALRSAQGGGTAPIDGPIMTSYFGAPQPPPSADQAAPSSAPSSAPLIERLPSNMQLAADGGYILPPNTAVPPGYEWLAGPALTPAQTMAASADAAVSRALGREPRKPTSGGTITRGGQVAAVAPSYEVGGYTGPGPKMKPAGVVHAGEFVIPKEEVAQFPGGVPALDAYFNTDSTKPKYGYDGGGGVPTDFIPPEAAAAVRALRAAGASPDTIQNAITNRRWKDLVLLANESAGFQRRTDIATKLMAASTAFDEANTSLATVSAKAQPKVEAALISSLAAMPPDEVYNLTTVKDPYTGAVLRDGVKLMVPANDTPTAKAIADKANISRLKQAAALAMSAPRDASAAPSPLAAMYARAEDIGTQEFKAEIGAARNKAAAAQKERDLLTQASIKEGSPGVNPLASVAGADDRDAKYQAYMKQLNINTGGETYEQAVARERAADVQYREDKRNVALATLDAGTQRALDVGAGLVQARPAGAPSAQWSIPGDGSAGTTSIPDGAIGLQRPDGYYVSVPGQAAQRFGSEAEAEAAFKEKNDIAKWMSAQQEQGRVDRINAAMGESEAPPAGGLYTSQTAEQAGPRNLSFNPAGLITVPSPASAEQEFYGPQETTPAQDLSRKIPEAFPKTNPPAEIDAERTARQMAAYKAQKEFRENVSTGLSAVFGNYQPPPQEGRRTPAPR